MRTSCLRTPPAPLAAHLAASSASLFWPLYGPWEQPATHCCRRQLAAVAATISGLAAGDFVARRRHHQPPGRHPGGLARQGGPRRPTRWNAAHRSKLLKKPLTLSVQFSILGFRRPVGPAKGHRHTRSQRPASGDMVYSDPKILTQVFPFEQM
jgi:hypothetical protein